MASCEGFSKAVALACVSCSKARPVGDRVNKVRKYKTGKGSWLGRVAWLLLVGALLFFGRNDLVEKEGQEVVLSGLVDLP